MMTEEERNKRLDEFGHKVAALLPGLFGSVIFDIKNGELAGVREEFRRRPSRPSGREIAQTAASLVL